MDKKRYKVLITGATGFIGSMLINRFLELNMNNEDDFYISAIVRNIEMARAMWGSKDINFIEADITNTNRMMEIDEKFDYIVHCAATTKSQEMITYPVETANGIINGTINILELAKRCDAKSMVYLSSMEVYGQLPDNGEYTTEENLGDIDVFSVRSCYPLGKRMAENLCYCYFKEYGVPVKIARLAQVFGKGILVGESRVFAQIANSVRYNRDIMLHTEGKSVGNYCDSEDAVEAILILLQRGINGESYNIANEEATMTISEMAEMVADKVAGGSIKVVYDIPKAPEEKFGYASSTGLRLSIDKIKSLGWHPKTNIETMYRNMIEWMNNNDFSSK